MIKPILTSALVALAVIYLVNTVPAIKKIVGG
jgi:hypothetical protein